MIAKLRKIASKVRGWQSISDIARKLKIAQSSAYVYISKLDKAGFVYEKIKKSRGTFYRIEQIPKPLQHQGMLAKTELTGDLEEFANEEISAEQKIAFLIREYKKKHNSRYIYAAQKSVRKIRNWPALYRYINAYKIRDEFAAIYKTWRQKVAKCPRMPLRYRRLLYAG